MNFRRIDKSNVYSQKIGALLKNKKLIIASNRGPVDFYSTPTGKLKYKRGSGGLVSALLSVFKIPELKWIANYTPSEKILKKNILDNQFAVNLNEVNISLLPVFLKQDVNNKYYDIICNSLLWFVHHYLWDVSRFPNIREEIYDAWKNGYVKANKIFAQRIIEEIKYSPEDFLILLQDYHLYLCPKYIRKKVPQAKILQFIHIPWPQPNYFKILPNFIRDEIIKAMLENDIIGFQIKRYANNFLWTCEEILNLKVDYEKSIVYFKDRPIYVNAYPVSIDRGILEKEASKSKVLQYEREIEKKYPYKLIVKVDRTDMTKNIVRSLLGYETFLTKYPQFLKKVKFLACFHPSRQSVEEYRKYVKEIRGIIYRINRKYSRDEWIPIKLRLSDNFPQSLAALKQYDVLIVNSIFDGMNLVAKEGVVLNKKNGVLILSENTGVCEELGRWSLIINPCDVHQTAERIYQALILPGLDRKRRSNSLKKIVVKSNNMKWICHQISDLLKTADKRPKTKG